MTERDIPGFEGLYTINEDGRVWSAARRRPVSIWKDRNGYAMATLCVNYARTNFAIHALLLTVFVGNRPTSQHYGRHLNGDRADNRLENLDWHINEPKPPVTKPVRIEAVWLDGGETARDIPGYEGLYKINVEGKVWSVSRGHLRSVYISKTGYPCVKLCKEGKIKHFRLHTLLLEVFVGPRPSPTHQGCHNNGVRDDYRLSNLRWDTPKNNCLDKKAHGTEQVGENHGSRKLTAAQVLAMRASNETHIYWAKKFNVDPMTVAYARKNKTWRHLNGSDNS